MNKLDEIHRTTISLTKETYDKLKRFGYAGESLDDALNRVLENVKEKNQ